MKIRMAASVAIVLLLAAFVVKLALAPLYGRFDADQCHRAYAAAHTRGDTARVDSHPYRAATGPANQRCSTTRGVTATATADILSSGQR